MGKSRTLETNMVFVCYLLLKEANTHMNLICFDHNFDHLHISVATFVLRKQSEKPQFLKKSVFGNFCNLIIPKQGTEMQFFSQTGLKMGTSPSSYIQVPP